MNVQKNHYMISDEVCMYNIIKGKQAPKPMGAIFIPKKGGNENV